MTGIFQQPLKAVTLAGTGPGDPSLLTLRVLHVLQTASVLLFDNLVSDEILALASASSIKINVGKRAHDGHSQDKRLETICHYYEKFAAQGEKIARLKSGDPLIFARSAEEILFLKSKNIDFEVAPGITSGLAGASLMQMPLTGRFKNRFILIGTGQSHEGKSGHLAQCVEILKNNNMLVLYMAYSKIQEIARMLIGEGISDATQVLVMFNISTPRQHAVSTNLAELAANFRKRQGDPAVIYMANELFL